MEATKTLVHAFVSSRFDYCNSVLAGVSGQLLRRLQVIQNAAARLVTVLLLLLLLLLPVLYLYLYLYLYLLSTKQMVEIHEA